MFRSASNAPGADGVVFGSAQGLVATPPDAVGKIQTTIGPVTVMRAGGVVARVDVGEFVYQGDAIATGADGAVGIIFADGTVFNLSSDARAVLNEFAYDPNGSSSSALLSLAQGKFAFIAGKAAKTGGLRIDTPFASIRGSARDRGVGVLTLAALTFAAIEESQAASRHDAFLDDGTITYKDLPHGTFEIVTRDGRVIMADDPGETIVIDPTGSVARLPNSSSRMAELQQAQHSALATFSLGQEGGAAGGSSSPGFDIPVQLQPINFSQPRNDAPTEIVTINITPLNSGFIEILQPRTPPPPPPPPPTISLTAIAIANPNSAISIVNASAAHAGFPIVGITSEVEDGRTVTITIVNSANQVVYTGTTTVTNGSWLLEISSAAAKLIPDGNYTVIADVTNALGNTGHASKTVLIDTVAAALSPPDLIAASDSGSSSADKITNVTTPTVAGGGAEADATVTLYDTNGTVLGTAVADGSGHWSITSSPLSDGGHKLTATQFDLAGNTSAISAALSVTIDTTPAAPPGVLLAHDTGSSASDHITQSGALTISGIETGAFVEYSTDGGTHWSSSFTAVEGANTVQIRQTDVAGNISSATTFSFTLDTVNPTVAVDIVDASLNDGDNSSLVTFSFSEAVDASTVANLASGAGIAVTGGTLSALTWNAAHTFATATFTASDDSVTPGSVTVAAGSYTDVAGNLGSAGGPDTVPIDTSNLTVAVDIVDASLSDPDNSSLVTFSFSEAVGASTVANLASGAGITVTGGTLSALTWNAAHTFATATFTASDDSVTPGSVTVAAGSYTDVAGNLGSAGGPDTVPIDTRNPTVAVDIVDASLSDPDNSSLVTFSFSEAVGASTVANLASGAGITVTGGTLSALTWNAAHTVATATFTASDDSVTPGSVTVAAGSYTDVAGNLGSAGGPDTVPIDTRNPTVAVDIVDASLNDGDNSSLVTFSFSEAVGASTVANLASGAGITVTGGTLSALTWNAAHTVATATFTASDDSVTPGSVAVAAGSYTDVAGNLGSAGSDTVPIDTRNLTVAVDIVDASLNDGDNSSLVTFSFSEAVGASTVANLASGAGITVTGGTLSALTWNAAHTVATATFTASDDSVTPGSVTVAAGSYTDVAGNLGSAGGPDTVPIDTRNPTVAVDIVDASLSDPDNSSLVTFSFSEAVGASTVANLASGAGITVTGGTLSALTWNAAHTFATATFTASDDSVTPGSVTVAAGSYTDVAGNLGSAGGPDTVPIDTRNPTVAVDIVDASLNDGDNSSLVTFSFSEAVGASTVANLASGAGITVTGGTLSALTWNAAHTFATATFTASDDSVTPGSVAVAAGSYTDVAGNLGSAGSDTIPIDTRNLTVAVDIVDASLSDPDNSSLVTFSFSEAVGASTVANLASGAGITVTGGTLSALTWNAAHTFATATFTASDDSVTPGSVAVAAGSYTDVAGNLGSAGSDTVPIDTRNPTVAVDIVDASLSDPDNSSLVTFSFSEAVGASTVANLASGAGITVTGGTLSALTWNAAHTFATATFTASDDSVTPGSVTVAAGSYTDVAGNLGSAGGPDTVPIDTRNPTVAVDIVDASLSDPDNSSLVTFSFSEAVGASTVANLASGAGITVTGGTLSALTWNAAHTFATATFTASDDSVTPGSVTVAAGSYTDVAGNLGSAGGPDTVPIDTRNPTVAVDIVDASLNDGDNSSLVTFSFSEAVGASTVANLASGAGITVTGGTLSALTWNAAHTFATATFTASDDSVTPGSVAVAAGSYTDVAGNLGSVGSDTVPIDTRNPTVAVDIVDASLSSTDNSSQVTFNFSEAPGASFTQEDITASHGTISNFAMVDATHYTATLTAEGAFLGAGSVSVAAGSYTDAAGNTGAAGSDTVTINTTADPNDFDSQATGGGLQGNTFFGTPVRDVILAINQAQFIYGGAGNDEISGGNSGTGETIWGGSGDDTINGNNGVDILYGGSGIDTIGGGEGGDTIIGGYGADELTGGSGPDIFKYLSVTDSHGNPNGTISYDTISDFSPGNDDIDLTAFGAAFTFFKQGALARADSFVAAHTIAWFFDGNQTIVYANPTDGGLNGGSSSLLEIHLTGVSSVNQNDFLTTNTLNLIAPAGVAGEPINLGLTTPSAEDGTLVTVTIADAPSGWTLNGGTLLDDGTWMVQTSDPRALAITSPGDFAGALLLNVTETWTQSDGSPVTMTFADNVEVYPVGSPIFAWSGQDFLTGSSGKDLFVLSQPIGVDTIYSFDPSEDWIDLIGYAGFANFEDVQRHLAEDGAGNAVITLADGQSITLSGVPVSSLSASNFVFDHTPAMGNAGTMTIDDGAMLPLSGIITNTGTIALDSAGRETRLELIQDGITLQGGGQVVLSDSSENVISGTIPSVTLTNVDNTISGAGQLGAGQMVLINNGTIIAIGTHALVIDTGPNAVTNAGTLEATGSGGLILNSDIVNSGLIWANGGNITINGAVTGAGNAMISGAATLELGAESSANVSFGADAAGTLILRDPSGFTGTISGLSSTDHIDLANISYGIASLYSITYSLSTDITTLVITDGTITDAINLLGNYTINTAWHFSDDGHGGTIVSDAPVSATSDLLSVQSTSTDNNLLLSSPFTAANDNGDGQTADGTVAALKTAVSDPDGGEMSGVTISALPSDVTLTDDALVDASRDSLDGADAAQLLTINGAGAGDHGSLTVNGALTLDAGAFQLAIKQQRKRDNADGRHGDRANGDLQAASIAIGAAVLFLIENGNCTIAEAATYDGSSIAENDAAGTLSNSDAALKFNIIARPISGALADGGTVEVADGRLEMPDTASATGVVKIDAGATPQFDGDRAVNVTLADSTGELGSTWTFSHHAHGGAVVAHQNTDNHGPAAQSPDLSSQAASHAPSEIPLATSNNGANSLLLPISAPNREPGNAASPASEFVTDHLHPADANTGNHGLEPQSLEASSQAALQTPLEIPPAPSDNGATNLSDSFNSPALPSAANDIASQAAQDRGPPGAALAADHGKDSKSGHDGVGESHGGNEIHSDHSSPALPSAANDRASQAAQDRGPPGAALAADHGKDSNSGHDGIAESHGGNKIHSDHSSPALPSAANDRASQAAQDPGPPSAALAADHGKDSNSGHDGIAESHGGNKIHTDHSSAAANDSASQAAQDPGPPGAALAADHGKDSNSGHDGIGESHAGNKMHSDQSSPALPSAANDIAPQAAAQTPGPPGAAAVGEHGKDSNSGHDGIGESHTGNMTHLDQPSPALPIAANDSAPQAAQDPGPPSATLAGDHGKDSNFGHDGIGESHAGNKAQLDHSSPALATVANDVSPQADQDPGPPSSSPVGNPGKDQFAFDSHFGHDGESPAGNTTQFDQPSPALTTAANDSASQAAQNPAPLSAAPVGDHAKDQFAFDSNFGHDGESPAGNTTQFDQPSPALTTAANDIAAQAGQNQAPLSAALAGDHAKDQFAFDSNFGHDGIGESHAGNMTQPDQPIFQTVSDILAHTAEAHSAQAVAADGQNHDAALTPVQKDKPLSDFIIHA